MPELALHHFLIVCPLIFISCFVDAVAGGGGLISLPAYLIAGLPAHHAIATNKMSASMGASMAVFKFARLKHIPWRIALVALPFALGGSAVGSRLALMLSDQVFKYVMLVILPLIAFYVMRKDSLIKERAPLSDSRERIVAVCAALVIGMYDGFYGPGTGVFLILALTGIGHMNLKDANGTAKLINFATNISALAVFLTEGVVVLPLGITAGLFGFAGGYLGAKEFDSFGAKLARPVILIVLVIFFGKLVLELSGTV